MRKPHTQASTAGATPKVITSASESSSRPKGAGSVSQSRDGAVEEVKDDGDSDSLRRMIEVIVITRHPRQSTARSRNIRPQYWPR